MPVRFKVGDVKSWHHCQRRVWYDHNPPQDFVVAEDPFDQLIRQLGETHELAVKETLGEIEEARDIDHTRQLIEQGAPAIFQAAFVDEAIGVDGRPDFLIKQEDGSYQVADAKLAKSLKSHPEIRIQVALYRKLLGSPLDALVYLGNGEIETVGTEADNDCEAFIESITSILESDVRPDVRFSASKCSACPYDLLCRPGFVDAGDLSLTYGLDARSLPGLAKQGIETIADLAAANPDVIEDVAYLKGPKKNRVVLQAKSQLENTILKITDPVLSDGTWVHFDIEDYPLTTVFANGDEVYLWGLLKPPHNKESFVYSWSDGGPAEDERAWRAFVEQIRNLREEYDDLVLAHYSRHEVSKLRRYAARYEMTDDPTVSWLLGTESPLLDLLPKVRDSFALPLTGYGLKQICKDPHLVNFMWELEESGSQWSVVRYHDFLNTTDVNDRSTIRNEILTYNRDDVRATHALEQWLRNL